ncbi:conserved hypothetical protein [Flavobacterium sp. 9AF]|uniref:hypothetical protein n=1 Tax=Flavobacterium sp. 9AF TaxID=2653142 RepID=UPI0012F236A4|nr:hypothetical protein [Flavobacterium sp. 9AF]VXB49311.1 conserved hypothetical protein [Flavobacterium sp. 9AF]
MNFESKILKNTKISEDYFDGDYKFDFLPNIIGIQYAITNTVEKKIINELRTNRFEKFTHLENLFIKLINFLNKNEFENYKVEISQKLSDESLKHWKPEKREKERKRLCNEIYLDSIGIEWRKDFWDFENDEIIYNEKYEIVLGFTDDKHRDERSITVEINPENLQIDDVFFE